MGAYAQRASSQDESQRVLPLRGLNIERVRERRGFGGRGFDFGPKRSGLRAPELRAVVVQMSRIAINNRRERGRNKGTVASALQVVPN